MFPPLESSDPSDASATRWSQILQARQESGADALQRVVERYVPAIRLYLRAPKWQFDEHSIDALVQKFVERRLLNRVLLRRADPDRGSFRALLRTAIHNFVVDELRSPGEPLARRGALRPIDSAPERQESGAVPAPADAIDAWWATQVLQQAISRLHEECRRRGLRGVWEVFEARLLRFEEPHRSDETYDGLAVQLGFGTPKQAANALVTAKRVFRQLLEEVLREEADDGTSLADQLAELRRVFASGVSLDEVVAWGAPGDAVELSACNAWSMVRVIEHLSESANASLQEQLQNCLKRPWRFLVEPAESGICSAGSGESLRDLLLSSRTSIDQLQEVKAGTKRLVRAPQSEVSLAVLSVIYFACQAAARLHAEQPIGSASDAILHHGFVNALEQDWLDDSLRALFEQALAVLPPTSFPPAPRSCDRPPW